MLRRNGPVVKSVESVLRPEGSLWGERFVEEVGVQIKLVPNSTHITLFVRCNNLKRKLLGETKLE